MQTGSPLSPTDYCCFYPSIEPLSMTRSEKPLPPNQALVFAAFTAVYLIWGANFLAIRYAVETIPPFFMGGARFLIAGLMLYGLMRLMGTPRPGLIHWAHAAVAGILLLALANGLLNWAQKRVPSGVAALLIAVTPLWFAVLDWLLPRGTRPNAQTLVGLLVGFGGAALLATTRDNGQQIAIDPVGAAALIAASFCWACGSLYIRYTPNSHSAILGGAMQMITGGGLLFAMGFLADESGRFDFAEVSTRSIVGFLFLLLISSSMGFTSYCWLLKVSTPARVSTYTYVNPVVAIILGWSIGGESLTPRMLAAAAIVIVSVIIILTQRSDRQLTGPQDSDAAAELEDNRTTNRSAGFISLRPTNATNPSEHSARS